MNAFEKQEVDAFISDFLALLRRGGEAAAQRANRKTTAEDVNHSYYLALGTPENIQALTQMVLSALPESISKARLDGRFFAIKTDQHAQTT